MVELTPWRPFGELPSLRREMDRLFDRFFGERPGTDLLEGKWIPALDVVETTEAIVVNAEVPGMDPKDIHISLTSDTLTIKGEKGQEKEEKEETYYRVERSYGSFSRVIRIPVSVESDKIAAHYKNGVLKIILPKKEEVKPKEIKVEVQ
ncbi:MAG: Hsp20/alpha crystallin family protein [Thermodesulfobacteriota bacterium]|nr:Hsp20/alpha crystallin family protein [Thermodesulfobacteriota bacterium]